MVNYISQRRVLGYAQKASQGDNFFVADNPAFGVTFTYFLKDAFKTKEAIRKEKEGNVEKEDGVVAVPNWSDLEAEAKEIAPSEWLFIFDENGNTVRKLKGANKKGLNRMTWDLRTSTKIGLTTKSKDNKKLKGVMTTPGSYQAQLFKKIDGKYVALSRR